MKEFEKLKYEIDLISKGEHNQEFTGVYQRLTELKQALQLLQPAVISSLPCHHNFIQKDTYWKSCTHCGTIAPLGQ